MRALRGRGRHEIATGLWHDCRRRTTIPAVRDRGVPSMCDYSLQYVASRPAKVGDKLVSTKFSNSITGGFAAVGEPNVAVCLLPGTEVAFENEVECDHALGIFSNWMPGKKLGEKVARFRQVKKEQPHVHHDALEFPGGQIVLLTRSLSGSASDCAAIANHSAHGRGSGGAKARCCRRLIGFGERERGRRNRSDCGGETQTSSRR